MGNSNWIFWKFFPRSGLLKEHFVTIDASVINADFIERWF